jgi:hypothetical protein
MEHLVDEYARDIDEHNLDHLEEIVAVHDYGMDGGAGGKENFIERSKKNYENRALHQHVFTHAYASPLNFRLFSVPNPVFHHSVLGQMLEYFDFEVIGWDLVDISMVVVGIKVVK